MQHSSHRRLQCDVCKTHKTQLRCPCKLYVCNPATGGRRCLLQHLAEVQANRVRCAAKRRRTASLSDDEYGSLCCAWGVVGHAGPCLWFELVAWLLQACLAV